MKTVNLIFGIHNHQPLGNFGFVFEHAADQSYSPFLEELEKFPGIRMGLHYSGTLLEWLEKNRPGLVAQLRKMIARGQVEIMGGAYYEAILSIIPDDDKFAQLNKLNRALRRTLKTKPQGMWLAERVWEQHLTRHIVDAGMRYITVDDTHFKYAGFTDEELLGYYVTEEQGRTLSVFPISKMLRYTIPFQPVETTIEYLRSIATEEGDRIVVYADDGEKFGVWPKTYDHVYRNGWLRDFFQALSDNSDWIKIRLFNDVVDSIPPLGRTYLPNSSYAEMMHWALPAHHFSLYEEFERYLKQQGLLEKYGSFFKGGFWRNFLAKYPESNNMHKKMLRLSARARNGFNSSRRSRTKQSAGKAYEKILASQCNDPYWHGIFGGLYLPNLRFPVYRSLLEAERELDKSDHLNTYKVERVDFDGDGREELLLEGPQLNCYIAPHTGGSIFELDYKPSAINVLDIVSRREEGYHEKLRNAVQGETGGDGVSSIHDVVTTKEPGLERHLNYDTYRRGSLIDHFFAPGTTIEDIWRGTYDELGDFVRGQYDAKTRKTGKNQIVELERLGTVRSGSELHRLRIKKKITLSPLSGEILIEYHFTNPGSVPIDLWFGAEFNVGLQAGDAPDRYYYIDEGRLVDSRLRSMGEVNNVSFLGLKDEWLGIDVTFATQSPTSFFRFPIETVTLSEAGFERIYQSSVVIPTWKFQLKKHHSISLKHEIKRFRNSQKGR